MALTTAQKNELATRLIEAQQTNNYGSFNDLVKQLRLTQTDFLENFPAINQAGINEQIGRGAVVPKTAPAATTFTTGQVSAAIRDALNAGYTVQQARMGAMTNFGLSSEEFDKALKSIQGSRYTTTFSDAQVAQAIRDSLAQGFTFDQARQGALANYGVSDTQFDRALALASGGVLGTRGSAPLYQFPGLLADRQDMPTGAQRFISRAPGSLLFDVPKVEGGQFTFTPGAFDYNAIRNQQAGADQVKEFEAQQAQIQPTVTTTPKTTPTTIIKPLAAPYSDAQVAQALKESMGQGFSLEQSLFGAASKYGITQDQLTRAQALLPSTTTAATSTTPTASTVVPSSSVNTGLTATSQYTDAQVAQAIKESMAQGFSLVDSMAGATRVYRIPSDQVYRAADSLFATNQNTQQGLPPEEINQVVGIEYFNTQPPYQANLLAPTTQFSDLQIAQAIMDSLGQGFDMGQIQMGAFNNFGVDQEQFTRAASLLPSIGYTIGQGFTR
jgi:hypothetical protein